MDRHRQRQWGRPDERGFTLVELMVVVVIVAVLAAIVVPVFTSEAKKVKAKTEVNPMMTELATKQERYRNENNGLYKSVAECPTPANNTAKAVTSCQTAGSDWLAIGVNPPEQTLKCSYEVIVGTSTDDPATLVPAGSTYVPPTGCCATSWYMIHAKCDADANGVYSHYVSASFDAKTHIDNEGQ